MNTNNSQPGHFPSESSFIKNNEDQSNIDQLLSIEILTTSQPSSSSSSSIQFNPTDMITDIQQHNNVPTRQHARRGQQNQQEFQQRQEQQRQQREEQRRLREEQQRLQQEQQQQQRERQRRRRERNQRRYEQWQDRIYQREQERYRREQEEQEHDRYLQQRSPTFDELMDEILEERQLETYDLERMTPQERQEIWEQEHLNELQGNPARRAYELPLDNIERYAKFLQDQRWWDEHEQAMRVYDMQNNAYTEECRRNDELLMQKQEWEDVAFRLQQLQ
jgi:hypothetical protein